MDEKIIYWTLLKSNEWNIYIVAIAEGLCYVGSQNGSFEEIEEWVKKKFPKHRLVQDKNILKPYEIEFEEYFKGKRKAFTIPIFFQGTPFQVKVWEALLAIPYGKKITYSEVANSIYNPAAIRAVGAAIGANPLAIIIPCHRVIGKNGSLTGFRGGLDMKKNLLSLEDENS